MDEQENYAVGRKVAIIGTRGYPSYYGGFETAVRKLAPFLADKGWDVTVYGRHNSVNADDPTLDVRISRVTTFGLEKRSLSTLTYGLTSVLHACVIKPDVALVMNVANGFWLPLLRLRGIPTLVNVDGMEWERAKWGRVARTMFRWGARLTARFADELVSDANEIARRWRDEFGRDSTFIPYGGDLVSPQILESGLKHRGYVLVVARFVPENTIAEFFEAADRLSEHFPIVVVGSSGYGGELDEAARALASKHTNFTWLGRINDDSRLYSLWQHAGVYFHGHSVGGTNPALVQAMATGAPTVALDTPFNREVLGERGTFTSNDPKEIFETVHALMNAFEDQELNSKSNLDRGSRLYSWESVLSKYNARLVELSRSSLQRKPSPALRTGK
jgi:glycosyltransferase involved in cell wall biosynthesis